MLRQTLTDHKLGVKSADDTISIFDEIFASNCSTTLDESLESDFNSLLDQVDENAKSCDESDVIGESATEEVDQTPTSPTLTKTDDKENQILSPILKLRDDPQIVSPAEEAEKSVKSGSRRCHSSSSPTLSKLDKSLEKQDGKYCCGDCGKEFKFLTYLKSHQNSKVSCKKIDIKRKRPSLGLSSSMNISKLL